MKGLKQLSHRLIVTARLARMLGDRAEAAVCLDKSGELRRTAYYVYGASSRF